MTSVQSANISFSLRLGDEAKLIKGIVGDAVSDDPCDLAAADVAFDLTALCDADVPAALVAAEPVVVAATNAVRFVNHNVGAEG